MNATSYKDDPGLVWHALHVSMLFTTFKFTMKWAQDRMYTICLNAVHYNIMEKIEKISEVSLMKKSTYLGT